jgi:hypothetical protein
MGHGDVKMILENTSNYNVYYCGRRLAENIKIYFYNGTTQILIFKFE